MHCVLQATPRACAGQDLSGRRVLIVFGGWDGHEPGKYVSMLLPWLLSEGAVADTTSSLDIYTDSTYMSSVDLIIQAYTMSCDNAPSGGGTASGSQGRRRPGRMARRPGRCLQEQSCIPVYGGWTVGGTSGWCD
ncbi:MAG: hypothetical protein MZV63_48450 [Marinilabiliales bacterium]|nr:hypothetical protein [Marinilabiliales bacterium]